MRKLFLFFSVIFLFSLCSVSLAFEFQEYSWGQVKEDIIQGLKEEDKKIIDSQTKGQLVYEDNLFQEPCIVTMFFTPQGQELAIVSILWKEWKDDKMGDNIQKILIDQYGHPSEVSPYMRHYQWTGGFEGDKVVLDYDQDIKLIYYGGEYYEEYQKQVHAVDRSEL